LAVADGNVAIATDHGKHGFGEIKPTFVIHGDTKSVRVNGEEFSGRDDKVVLTGRPLKVKVLSG
jgi:hypothetical protein